MVPGLLDLTGGTILQYLTELCSPWRPLQCVGKPNSHWIGNGLSVRRLTAEANAERWKETVDIKVDINLKEEKSEAQLGVLSDVVC